MSQPSSGGGILHKVQARRKDFALKTGHGFGRPLLSVIVPVYNTAEYFETCLTSLLDGWEPWREVIVVDDGSTDGSRAIAERLAAADARLRVISGGHHGPAHARNLGVSKARGRYLAFVDSDDAVPPDALARLVESLEQSGSDLATGPFCEVRRGEPQFAQWIRVLHDTHVTGTSAAETPLVLRNFYPWNKAYRAAFWRSQGLAFREGSMFEDQPLVTEALLGAHGIDIVDAPAVYTWQRREDESSRSQVGFYRKKAVEARAEAIDLTRPVVTAAGRTVLDGWLYTVIEHYLPNYLRAFPKIDEEDIAAALALVRGAVTLEEIASVPRVDAATRALVWVAHEGDRAAVERLLADGFETPARWMRVLVDPVGPLRPSLEGSAAGRAALEAVAAARAQWLDFDPARFTPRTVETEWLDGDGVAVRGDLPLAGMFGVDAIAAGAVNLTGTFEDPW
ncbi:MAG: glycosyltransferase, partial [Bifidobacteriaceae bacterium]|nr:glycosyltransferase [Bifidobacteriaceae bacterium]